MKAIQTFISAVAVFIVLAVITIALSELAKVEIAFTGMIVTMAVTSFYMAYEVINK
ncbi:hypothetical protein GCM10011409_00010 [Lentibacillus populi]|uniref:Uncharacterized protein n=1 Tax=Lentibacillus populi TaxID=1827502 RepID=A0A9W5TTE5_9BACI|nr:hypothetical protein [Lentibacillus populi]GGB26704.1 hypothetical protein GCM10011409_00010 [Lentibacillus populi]